MTFGVTSTNSSSSMYSKAASKNNWRCGLRKSSSLPGAIAFNVSGHEKRRNVKVAIEVHLLPNSQYRVTRIAELGGTDAKGIVARDIFVAAAEGGGEGHVATGVVPRIVNEFAARGVRLDTNLFKKSR